MDILFDPLISGCRGVEYKDSRLEFSNGWVVFKGDDYLYISNFYK